METGFGSVTTRFDGFEKRLDALEEAALKTPTKSARKRGDHDDDEEVQTPSRSTPVPKQAAVNL